MELVFNPDELFARCEPKYMSASVFELGPCAGQITWRNCLEAADYNERLFSGCDYDALRDHFREYGAWEDTEIDAWDERELRALAIQEIAADYRTQVEHPDADESGHHFSPSENRIYAYFGI